LLDGVYEEKANDSGNATSTHLALRAVNPEILAEFYTGVFELKKRGRGDFSLNKDIQGWTARTRSSLSRDFFEEAFFF
jgi:hypothetical protein